MGDRGSSAKAASGDRHRPQQRMEGEEPRQERQQTAAEVQADDDYHVDPIELQKAQQWMEIMRQPPDARKIPQSEWSTLWYRRQPACFTCQMKAIVFCSM